MISLSNVGANHMSLYGYERATTPNIDRWAKDGIVFNDTFVQSSWTLPVATSLFTALYPYSHGISNRLDVKFLNEKVKTLPEILRDHGYKTAAFTGGLDYRSKNVHMKGFGVIEEAFTDGPADFISGQKEFASTLQKALSWMEENSEEKFFLFTHGYNAHCPFVPSEEFKGVFSGELIKKISINGTYCYRGYEAFGGDKTVVSFRRFTPGVGNAKDLAKIPWEQVALSAEDIEYLEDSYDEAVLSVDAIVGDFLGSIDPEIMKKTVVVIFSDHGEMFARSGRFGRAGAIRGSFYDDVLHVPLIIRAPGVSPKRVDGLVQIIDVMPTIFDMLSIDDFSMRQGKSLRPLISKNEVVNDYVFAGSSFNFGRHTASYKVKSTSESIRDNEWKINK